MLNQSIYTYLEVRYYQDNHAKYHKYFEEWVKNVTDNQLYYFNKDMNKSIK